MTEIQHLRRTNGRIKFPDADFKPPNERWGHSTFCGHIVDYAPTRPSKESDFCEKCLRLFIKREENRIKELKRTFGK